MANGLMFPIDSVVNYRDPYDNTTVYYYKNWVSMCGCVFEAQSDCFSGVPPLTYGVDGSISLVNQEYWKCIIDNVKLYNNVLSTNSLAYKIKKMEADNVVRDKDIANIQAKLEELVIASKGEGYYIIFKLNGTPVDTIDYDSVNSMEDAYVSFEADFYNNKTAYKAASATLTCVDESGKTIGSVKQVNNSQNIVVDGSGLNLSNGCKTIQVVVSDADGNTVISGNIGVSQGASGIVTLTVYLLSGGNTWRTGQGKVATIAAAATKGDYDITDAQDDSQFIWTRESADDDGDKNWNSDHTKGSKTLELYETDMSGNTTTFVCTLYNSNGEAVQAKKMNFHL